MTPSKSKWAQAFAKVLHIRSASKIVQIDRLKNAKVDANLNYEGNTLSESFNKDDEELQEKMATETLLAKVFASLSSVKASYVQLQYAQSPYDPDEIQAADRLLVSELKTLSELKRCYSNKQFDSSPEREILEAESKELLSVTKTYEFMEKKLELQLRLKDSEIIFLREKLEECNRQNRSIEKKLNQSGSLSVLDNLHISGLSPSHFTTILRHTVSSIRRFVNLIVNEMRSAGWDINASANVITEHNVVCWNEDHKCFAIESFVCREMFDSFNSPNFSLPNESLPDKSKLQTMFFGRFNELKSLKAREFLAFKPRSPFAKFCRVKYLKLIHPKMESSFFGDLNQRNILNSGEFPDTNFFTSFAEMAKRVWLLHCLAFSFEPQAFIFQVEKGCRFSEVYMECVNDEMSVEESEQQAAFTVVPGFRIGKTVIQCQVYLSQQQTKVKSSLQESKGRN
ncbi:hypothetical protein Lalb_Chr19g0133771 [Lupinus albus]|uniref:Uncharacterized protein n=1 Tax=Lupinus albus TaxID=3870 RepID=A0A6A4P1M7_LUPAL|nr:hypothetical protein Lalb_Chr19g0133771 [Lupinus albus]